MEVVIGSGPSGVALALARLARGREITIIDGGRDLEPEAETRRTAQAEAMAGAVESGRADWMAGQFAAPSGQVRRYGSDFAMEPAEAVFAGGAAIALRSSRAAGGLSNLWGSAVLPWRHSDLAGWPIGADDLAPHWAAIARHIPVAGTQDDLAELFPAFDMAGRTMLAPGIQIARLLARLSADPAGLARLGVRVGHARQAVSTDCVLCGLCLHGCPWRFIWSARQTLEALRSDPRVTYRPGAVATAVSETPDRGVAVHLAGGETLRAARVFVAAGVLETARIVMASPGGPSELTLRDSPYAFLPMLHRFSTARRPDLERHHTLVQGFVEIDAPSVSPWLVHAQLYGWNEYYARDLQASYARGPARLRPAVGRVLEALARRLIVAQTFVHSDHAAPITLSRTADGRLHTSLGAAPDQVMAAALRHLARAMRLGGVLPLRAAARQSAPGASFHCGATLPMARERGRGGTDVLGRPDGATRIHIVDASVLPAIPATTITFGVMANAHRIGQETPDD